MVLKRKVFKVIGGFVTFSLYIMDSMKVLNGKMISKVKETKANFVVIAYDVVSENLEGLSEHDRLIYKSKRMKLQNELKNIGVMLNESVYIVSVDKVVKVLELFDSLYKDDERNSIKIVGSVFDEIAKEIILNSFNKLKDKVIEIIEKSEAEVSNINAMLNKVAWGSKQYESLVDDKERIRKKIYNTSKLMNVLENRVKDMELLDLNLATRMRNIIQKIAIKRKYLLDRC